MILFQPQLKYFLVVSPTVRFQEQLGLALFADISTSSSHRQDRVRQETTIIITHPDQPSFQKTPKAKQEETCLKRAVQERLDKVSHQTRTLTKLSCKSLSTVPLSCQPFSGVQL